MNNIVNALAIIGLIGSLLVYAADWQREQDKRISELDVLIQKQSVLLEIQVKMNEALSFKKNDLLMQLYEAKLKKKHEKDIANGNN